MHILIVDDDPDICRLLTMTLQDAGYTVVSMATGEAALEHLTSTTDRPCLILLDLMMPNVNGWEFREQQLADPALAAIPTVVFSAAVLIDAPLEALQAAAVVRKPLDFAAILALAAQYCAAEL